MPDWDEFTGQLIGALRRRVQGDAKLCESSRAQEKNRDKHSCAEEPYLNIGTRAISKPVKNVCANVLSSA
jgi:hypothetical protein